jgi:hypothetical protein
MKNLNYKCVVVALICAGAFLLAVNQLAFAIMCINVDFVLQTYIPMSGDFDILPVKIGVCLLGIAAIIFIIDLLASNSNRNKKS